MITLLITNLLSPLPLQVLFLRAPFIVIVQPALRRAVLFFFFVDNALVL